MPIESRDLTQKKYTDPRSPRVVIEGRRWDDAGFYGKWLSAAAKADTLWKTASKDPNFERESTQLFVNGVPYFAVCACGILELRLQKISKIFFIHSPEWETDEEGTFVMMKELGFFCAQNGTLPDDHSVPSDGRKNGSNVVQVCATCGSGR
jgi:hypothetical protein